jgi:hypothetical protein
MVSTLNLPKGVRVVAPPFFESPDYRLEVVFTNGKELREKIARLLKRDALEEIGNPWERGAR